MPNRQPHPLILASNSPRRRELLAEAGYDFEVVAPDPDREGGPQTGETAEQLVLRLAREKAGHIAELWAHRHGIVDSKSPTTKPPQALILGADTVAECDGEILGKPADRAHARAILKSLRGKIHRVLTGVCLWPVPSGKPRTALDMTSLTMETLSDSQIEDYLDSGLWRGKAGAFGYQDGIDWVRIIQGSPSNVVGLPLELLEKMLRELRSSEGATFTSQ
jgi:septum formation protein